MKLLYVEDDATITIKVSGYFHKRLTALLNFIMEDKTEEEIKSIMENIAKLSNEEIVKHPDAFHVETLLALIEGVEKSFKESNLIKEEHIDPPEESKTQD